MSAPDGITYRVNIAFDTKQVTITSFGIGEVDKEVDGHYNCIDELPIWMQERLATLSMLDIPPPPNDVDEVGARIGPYLYWVYK